MFACCHFYFRLHLLFIIIHITCISLSLRRTSAPIHLTSVLGVLEIQETSYIVIAWLLERDSFDLLLPEFDKPWVIHLMKTCCCSTNLCTWRPNTVYKNRRMRRHHIAAINLIKSIVFHFGVPHNIITYNGTNFTSKEFKSYCESMGIKLKFASVAHPKTNGQVEKANGLICNRIKKRLLVIRLQRIYNF
jgi:hypothetical protein